MDYEITYLAKNGKMKRKIVSAETEDDIDRMSKLNDGDVVQIVGIKYANDKGKEK